MLLHFLLSQILYCNTVANRLARRLHRKLLFSISKLDVLSIDCMDWNTPIIWVSIGQLWNVIGILTTSVILTLFKEFFYFFFEALEVRHNKVFLEDLHYKLFMFLNNIAKYLFGDLLWQRLKHLEHVDNSWIRSFNTHFEEPGFECLLINIVLSVFFQINEYLVELICVNTCVYVL